MNEKMLPSLLVVAAVNKYTYDFIHTPEGHIGIGLTQELVEKYIGKEDHIGYVVCALIPLKVFKHEDTVDSPST